ncbi:MAG: DUF2256 and DUF3253 domain-containing protein [Planctomycetota bacterium]
MNESKVCPVCGRRFAWRKKWARSWSSVRYCSERCRSRKGTELQDLETAILASIEGRRSICPSEVARAVGGEDWRPLMEPVRAAARRLAHDGRLRITQGGRVVDPDRARGPIRLTPPLQ